MAIITFFAKKRATLSLVTQQAELTSDASLRPCELFFKLDFPALTEVDLMSGRRRSAVKVQIREKGRPGFVLNETFSFYEAFPPTHTHLKSLRYIGPSGRHFCATFQKQQNRYCEILLIDFTGGQVTRHIPTDLPLWN